MPRPSTGKSAKAGAKIAKKLSIPWRHLRLAFANFAVRFVLKWSRAPKRGSSFGDFRSHLGPRRLAPPELRDAAHVYAELRPRLSVRASRTPTHSARENQLPRGNRTTCHGNSNPVHQIG